MKKRNFFALPFLFFSVLAFSQEETCTLKKPDPRSVDWASDPARKGGVGVCGTAGRRKHRDMGDWAAEWCEYSFAYYTPVQVNKMFEDFEKCQVKLRDKQAETLKNELAKIKSDVVKEVLDSIGKQ